MCSSVNVVKFQFHKGTIKTAPRRVPHTLREDFNSIKVRLKRAYIVHSDVAKGFQFHKGTIKTRISWRKGYTVPVISIP